MHFSLILTYEKWDVYDITAFHWELLICVVEGSLWAHIITERHMQSLFFPFFL